MINTKEESISFGLLRVMEFLKNPNDVFTFEEACCKIKELYNNILKGDDTCLNYSMFEQYDFSEYVDPAKTIFSQAKKHNIFLDRPNDPMCCLVTYITKQYA